MTVVILQSNYLPWKGYFDLIHDADAFVFYDEVKYTKNDWRNRNKIYSKNGIQWLTIPIVKDAVKQKISEVQVDQREWQDLHFDAIYFAYKRAPYFSQVEVLINDFYRSKKWQNLSELNQYCIKTICSILGITTQFYNASDFNLREGRVEKLIGILGDLKATQYISGPAAREYLSGSEHMFSSNNITLKFKDYSGYPEYQQLSSPFENYVSIIDLIANVRQDEIADYIWKWRTQQ
jgi:hypothetical protein